MHRFILCAGANGSPAALKGLSRAASACRPDGILFAGGVLGPGRRFAPRSATLWGMPTEESLFVERFFEALGKLDIFSAVIPGTDDTPLEDFLRIGMHAEVEFPGVHLVHATLTEQADLAVCGLGGLISGNGCHEPDHMPRVLAEYHLRTLWGAKQPRRVLLIPTAPWGKLGGDEGSTFTGELIDSYHPSLCVTGGSSERRGFRQVGETLVVNPGALTDGWAAWLDWESHANRQVEFLDLRDPVPKRVAAPAREV
jgi:Icc-related predicted phosphoesterase